MSAPSFSSLTRSLRTVASDTYSSDVSGFAGQKMIPHSIEKIARARAYLDAKGKPDAEIEVDGNVSLQNAVQMRKAGANIFVAGTSGIFYGTDLAENIRAFRETLL